MEIINCLKKIECKLPGSRLSRARVAVSATFAMVGGGQNDPPLTQKLGKLEG